MDMVKFGLIAWLILSTAYFFVKLSFIILIKIKSLQHILSICNRSISFYSQAG